MLGSRFDASGSFQVIRVDDPMLGFILANVQKIFPLGDPPIYEPPPESSLAAVAEKQGLTTEEIFYDAMLENDGKALFLFHLFNFTDGNCDHMIDMFRHPQSVLGLSDGGAHCGQICDASTPTFMLTHWARDRQGERLPLEFVIKQQTRDTAALYGLLDRGLVKPGYRADLNVIDFERLRLHAPELRNDLPAGGRRFVQFADGYLATIVAGEVVSRNGKPTGNLTAYDLVQQALSHWNRYTRKDLLEARRLMEQAVELDPEYAWAWSGLGATYTVESAFLWNLDPTLMDRAEDLVNRALALDPTIPGPHIVLAGVNLFRDRPAAAAIAAEKAIELAPSWPRAHYFLGVAMAQQGRFIDATRAINRAQRLDPKSPPGLLVIIPYVNLAAGRTDVAVEMFEQVRTSNTDMIIAQIPLAALYESDGRHAEAQALAREILDVNPDMTADAAAGKFVASLLGDDRAAEWRVALRSAGLP